MSEVGLGDKGCGGEMGKLFFVFSININFLKRCLALAGVPQLVGTSPYRLKGCEFDFRSGHIPRL